MTDAVALQDQIDEIPWSEVSAKLRKEQLGKMFVDRPIEDRIVAAIDAARSDRLIYTEPHNVAITGETGVGKTAIATRYLAANREYRDPETGCMVRPVLYVDIRNSSTPKAVAIAMLRALGLDENGQQTLLKSVEKDGGLRGFASIGVPELSHMVKTQMVGQKVEAAILDEFHNTVTDNGAVRLNRIAEWVKDFAKSKTRTARQPDGLTEENIPFVLMGTRKVLNVLDATINPELASITPYRIVVDRYRYDTEAEKTEFRGFLNDLDYELPFDQDSSLGQDQLADKLHVATFGLLRQLGHIIKKAAEIAIDDGSPCIAEHHLHAAVELMRGILESALMSEDSVGEARRAVSNPFLAPQLQTGGATKRKRGYRPDQAD